MANPQSKEQMREQLKALLNSLTFFDLIPKSHALSERFFEFVENHQSQLRGRVLVSFCPVETEPQINVEKEAKNEPYSVAYVRIEDWKNRTLSARLARRDTPDLWEEFTINESQSLYQPKQSEAEPKPDDIALILVPCLGMSLKGSRLGRGAGFYDRFLQRFPHALRVGICFDEQCRDDLPTDPWDEPVDMILTDKKIVSLQALAEWQEHGKVLKRERK